MKPAGNFSFCRFFILTQRARTKGPHKVSQRACKGLGTNNGSEGQLLSKSPAALHRPYSEPFCAGIVGKRGEEIWLKIPSRP